MKVLFVYGEMTVEKTSSGFHHNFLNDIIERYRHMGDLTVCTACKNCQESSKTVVNMDHVRFCAIEKENSIKKRFLNRTYNKKVLRELVQEHDLIVVHAPNSVSDLAAGYAHRYHKKYLVVLVGCGWGTLWYYNWKGKLLAPLSYLMTRRTVSGASYVWYVTESFLQFRYPTRGLCLGCSDVRIEATDEKCNMARKERWRSYQSRQTTLKMVTVGAVDFPLKGQQFVIEALRDLKKKGIKFSYYLIGGGNPLPLQRLAKRLGVADQVFFLGVLSHEKVLETLKEMDLYIQPSKQEGLPRSVIEAMSLGMPVLGTDVGGISELLAPDFLFQRGSVSQIVDLLSNDNMFFMNAIDRNWIKAQTFLPDKLARKQQEFFRKIQADFNLK